MRKFLSFIIIIISITSIISCAGNYESNNNYIKGKDAQYMYMSMDSQQYITASKDGYYFINGLYLYYCDFNTMNPIVLCNKPNCLHDKEVDETKKFNCNAFLITGNNTTLITIYNDYIYCYIDCDFLKDDHSVPELIRISLDGSERKTICELEQDITSMALHRGVLYYATSKVPSDKIEEEQGINYYEFKEYDIFKSFSKPNVIHSGKGIMATINDITPIGNKVRYTVYSVENNMFLGKEKSYDIKEKNITAIAEDINVTDMGPLTTDGENYIFTPIYISDEGIEYDDYIYTTNIVNGKSEKLFKRDSKDIMNYSDDKYIYIDNILSFDYENEDYSDFTRTITVYDKKGNKIDCIDVTGVDEYSYFIGGDERYMFVRGEDIEGAYIKYIDKSKIGTGNAKLETLFEIERKYLDTTVRRKLD